MQDDSHGLSTSLDGEILVRHPQNDSPHKQAAQRFSPENDTGTAQDGQHIYGEHRQVQRRRRSAGLTTRGMTRSGVSKTSL